MFIFFLYNQKTAYEMRIIDWSSDVCSSDLHLLRADVMNDEHDGKAPVDDKHRHPLREPMIWLVIALPLAAVLGGIWMMVLSSRSGSIDSVSDDVQRTGKIQTTDLGQIGRAHV